MARITKAQIRLAQKFFILIFDFFKDLYNLNLLYYYILSTGILYLIHSFICFDIMFILVCLVNITFIVLVQYKKNSINCIRQKDIDFWWKLDGWSFEKEVAKVLRRNGYSKVRVTKGSGDGGVDLVFYKGTIKYIAQCKHYKTPVGPEPVRALWGVKDDFNADVVVIIASSGLTKASKRFISNKSNYYLWTLNDIVRMARKESE